jgi:hypothetical protein
MKLRSNRCCSMNVLLLLLMFGVLLAQPLMADGNFTPIYRPTLNVQRVAGDIKIDGKLDDAGWRDAARADNFAEHQPGDQTKPPVETYALMTYDDNNIYVAFMCYDDPTAVRASFGERERVGNDDNVCLCLDTYGDAAWAYTFNVNPYGIQADALWSPTVGEDGGYNLVWTSAAQITDSGYQVEMAIPFSALRFPKQQQQTWRVDFWRNHPREAARGYSWAAYDRNEACWPCQWGTVTGVEGVEAGRGIEVMPSVVGFQSGALQGNGSDTLPYHFKNDDIDGDISIGGKYSISSDITFEGTYNPDFSQIEADAGQIDVNTTFALFYPERRPFFQEGSDLFRTLFNSFYTRSINDPELATKATIRSGRTSIGYLLARDEHTPVIIPFEERSVYALADKSTSNIVRLRQTIGRGSYIGVIGTDRRLDDGGSGSVIATDGQFRVTPSLRLSYQAVLSHTDEPDDSAITANRWFGRDSVFWGNHTAKYDGESFWGTGGIGVLSYQTRALHVYANYWQVTPTYRADNGFDPKNNRRDFSINAGYTIRPKSGIIQWFDPSLDYGVVWNFEGVRNGQHVGGVRKNQYIGTQLAAQLTSFQSSVNTSYYRSSEVYGGLEWDFQWSMNNSASARFGDLIEFAAYVNFGRELARPYYTMSKSLSAGGAIQLKPHDRVLLEPNLNYTVAHDYLDRDLELYRQYIVRTRLSYQILRNLSLRLVVQYDDARELTGFEVVDEALVPVYGETGVWAVDPLLTYRLSAFSIFYIGSTQSYEDLTGYERDGDKDLPTPFDGNRLMSRQFFMKLQYLFQI